MAAATSKIRMGGAALNQTPFDWHNNKTNILSAIEEAKDQGIKLLCMPELCITGYGCEDTFYTNWLQEMAIEVLLEIVPFTEGIATTLGLPIKIDHKLYNAATFIENGRILGFTAKQFLARDGVHYEPRWFTPWERGKQTRFTIGGQDYPFGDVLYQSNGLTIGIEICEDAWVDTERPAYDFAQRGVKLILNPSASHFAFGKTKIREKLVTEGSTIINGVYLYANLLGNESGKMIYDGEIMLAQGGEMKQMNDRLSFKNTNVTCLDVEPHLQEDTQPAEFHHYADDKETEFHEAVTLGLFDYLRKSKSKGFVLSLSGGADSSSIAIMVATMVRRGLSELGFDLFVEKLGTFSENEKKHLYHRDFNTQCKNLVGALLITAYQATSNSSKETFEAAKELANSIGAKFYDWSIDEEVASYTSKVEEALGHRLNWQDHDITLQNIQARARSPIIWMIANLTNSLLLSTSNRSEADVGYATMDGDTSGSISPIAGVDKAFVLSYLRYAENQLGYKALSFVNSLKPTAELRPQRQKQTDEQDLMPYSVLFLIEQKAIRDRKSPVEIYKALSEELTTYSPKELKGFVLKFFRLWAKNQWKRERYAPSFHLDDFSVDPRGWYRFPILNGGYKDELRALELLPDFQTSYSS